MQITKITPENILDFCGGKASILSECEGFRPGTEGWAQRIFELIRERAPHQIGSWHAANMEVHFGMHQMMHGPRPMDPAYLEEYDAKVAESTCDMLAPQMELFCEPEHVPEWLYRNCESLAAIWNSPQARYELGHKIAVATIDGVFASRPTPNKVLARMGIVGNDSGWPNAVGEIPQEEEKKPKRRGRKPKDPMEQPAGSPEGARAELEPIGVPAKKAPGRPRGETKVRRKAALLLGDSWLAEITQNGIPVPDLMAVLGCSKQAVNKAMLHGSDGLPVQREAAANLVSFMEARIAAIQKSHALLSMMIMTSAPLQ